ncbi:hypothetical protein PLUTE_a1432 [Pseudoalteromonas luteoviolacea DSM 6061]|nr:hypothetical protein [Pseudoalteromonas luteoviolacea DSM 6061]
MGIWETILSEPEKPKLLLQKNGLPLRHIILPLVWSMSLFTEQLFNWDLIK